MNLKYCTITGADNNTSIDDMLRLSAKYPFVEWGILFGSQAAEPRFPGNNWVDDLLERKERMNLCAHLCGRYLRAQLEGKPMGVVSQFQRAQLNWHGQKWQVNAEQMHANMLGTQLQYIFQLDGVNDAHLQAAIAAGVNAAGIFDRSHGAGISPDVWPDPIPGVLCTYSGGIGPDNIFVNLMAIDIRVGNHGAPPYCIDMETKVRSDNVNIRGQDTLDMEKVEACLAAAAKYVSA